MNTTDPVAWHPAIHPSIPQGERLNAGQHPTNTILPQHDGLKTRQRPQNSVWPQYDWLQSRSAYQNKTVRHQNQAVSPEVSKGEHLIFVGVEIVEKVEVFNDIILPKHDWLPSKSSYQNKAVRPEVSKGEHLMSFNMETVEEVEALQAAIGESA